MIFKFCLFAEANCRLAVRCYTMSVHYCKCIEHRTLCIFCYSFQKHSLWWWLSLVFQLQWYCSNISRFARIANTNGNGNSIIEIASRPGIDSWLPCRVVSRNCSHSYRFGFCLIDKWVHFLESMMSSVRCKSKGMSQKHYHPLRVPLSHLSCIPTTPQKNGKSYDERKRVVKGKRKIILK